MDYQEIITFIMEMIGTVAFAISGAIVGLERKMDIFGVCVLGSVTAVGGGMVRDVVVGNIPPAVFVHPVYGIVAILTSCAVFGYFWFRMNKIGAKYKSVNEKLMLLMDSIGLGIFTVVGVNTGIKQGYVDNTFLLVFLGASTGVGGGLLRDMMAQVPPYILVKHIYACASIIGALVCILMYRSFGAVQAMIVASIVVCLIRFCAAHYRWKLPKIKFDEEG
ncbi:MAG: trimeric intracellular cation channel family protein [Anaerovoracaceae bacterium]